MKFRDYRDQFLAKIFRFLPLAWVTAIGGWLGVQHGRRGIRAKRRWAARMHVNLQRIWGLSDPHEREQHILEFHRRMGRVYAEIPVVRRLIKANKLEILGEEHLRNLSRPVIIISAHLGNWELVGRIPEILGNPCCAIYLPLPGAKVELSLNTRQEWGKEDALGELIPSGPGAMRSVTRAISSGSNLLLFVDEIVDGVVRGPKLGRDMPYQGNRWLSARLAIRYGLDVLPVRIKSNGPGKYQAIIEPKLTPPDRVEDEMSQARELADRIDSRVESWVRENPDDWYFLPLLQLDTHDA